MTLRLRVVSALVALAAITVIAFGIVVVRQRSVLVEQLDDQLSSVEENLAQADEFFEAQPAVAPGPPTGELYVAIHSSDSAVQQLARPSSDPFFAPVIDIVELGERASVAEPFSVAAVGGGGARMVAHDLGGGRWAVAALPTRTVEAAQQQLLVTVGIVLLVLLFSLGMVVFWVDRLGIKPILEVTRAAEERADGRAETRVELRSPNTEAGRLAASFNKMLDAREAADARQRRFVADASHELRTPLTTLQGYASLHGKGALTSPESVEDAMRRIGSEARRMSHLVEKLLTLASLDEGRPLALTDVDLTVLLNDLASDAAAIQPDRPIYKAIDKGLSVVADPELLTQALTTTIHNALRHTPTTSRLAIKATREPNHVRIEIADWGPGVEPEHLDHLFDRFYRSDTGRGRRNGGTGLGLAIAKAVAEAHGGTIEVTSTVGAGTAFVFLLPIAGPQEFPRNS